MKCNLKTVFLSDNDELKSFNGWTACTRDKTLFLESFFSIPIESANADIRTQAVSVLYSASIDEVKKEETLTITHEDFQFPTTEVISYVHHTLNPQPDDNFYYRILLGDRKDISLSPEFHVFIDYWFEDPYISDKYIRIIYASLPFDAPLILDSKKHICVSPF